MYRYSILLAIKTTQAQTHPMGRRGAGIGGNPTQIQTSTCTHKHSPSFTMRYICNMIHPLPKLNTLELEIIEKCERIYRKRRR